MPEPSIQDLSPVVPAGQEKEPVLLIDTSGSMSYAPAAGSTLSRIDVITEAMGTIVATLGAQDSQAEAEAAAGEDAGGLMTVTFASEAHELGDLNPANWRDKWDTIRWGGGTHIMPGWQLAVDDYVQEFGDTPKLDRPALLLLVITDGEASDMAAFEAECSRAANQIYICVAIIGYGTEHDNTLNAYEKIAAGNKHVRVVSFGSTSDPNVLAQGLISLAG